MRAKSRFFPARRISAGVIWRVSGASGPRPSRRVPARALDGCRRAAGACASSGESGPAPARGGAAFSRSTTTVLPSGGGRGCARDRRWCGRPSGRIRARPGEAPPARLTAMPGVRTNARLTASKTIWRKWERAHYVQSDGWLAPERARIGDEAVDRLRVILSLPRRQERAGLLRQGRRPSEFASPRRSRWISRASCSSPGSTPTQARSHRYRVAKPFWGIE